MMATWWTSLGYDCFGFYMALQILAVHLLYYPPITIHNLYRYPNTLEMLIDNGNTSNLVQNACRRIIATLRLNFGRESLRC